MLSKEYVKKVLNFVDGDETVKGRIIKQFAKDWHNMREIVDNAKDATGVSSSFEDLRNALRQIKKNRGG